MRLPKYADNRTPQLGLICADILKIFDPSRANFYPENIANLYDHSCHNVVNFSNPGCYAAAQLKVS